MVLGGCVSNGNVVDTASSVTQRHFVRRVVAAGLVVLASQSLSAQLLPKLLTPLVQPISQSSSTCSVASLANSPKLDAAVQYWARTSSGGSQQIIVSAVDGQLASVSTLISTLGATVLGTLPGVNALVTRTTTAQLAAISCATSVASISIDAYVTPTGVAEAIVVGDSLRATIGLPQDTPDAAGVTVAVIDSGIAPSADFGNRIVAFFDGTRGLLPASPSDAYGHGTHVAGLIAGAGSLAANGFYQGVAPRVRLIGMKVLDGNGAGRTSDVIRAVELTTLLRPVLGVDVINLSLGHPIYEPAARDPLVRAVEAASRAGIVVVAAAGNYGISRDTGLPGYGGITSPGNAPSAITVGAVDSRDTANRQDDRLAPYSSRGPSWYDGLAKPDILAPGHHMVSDAAAGSTLFTTYPAARVGSSYLRLSGTSMATAVASGAAALVIEAHRREHPGAPALTPNTIKAILEYSSIRVRDESGVEYDDLSQGAGSLNAAGAIEMASAIDTSRPVGSYWLTTGVTPATTLAGNVIAWSQRILWKTDELWGSILDTRTVAWALNTVWGSPNVWDSHIVWGTNVVWGDDSTWSNHIVWGTGMVGASSDDGDHIVWGTTGGPDGTSWGNLAEADSRGSGSWER